MQLTWEKYLLHIDGEGSNMYADILNGTRVAIPRQVTKFREQENNLRLIADNAVAYHTTMPIRYVAEGGYDRKSREYVRYDSAFANHVARQQRFNSLAGQAFYMAIPAGFCPVHAYWRDDLTADPYEPIYYQGDELSQLMGGVQPPRKGIIDCWVGNPFDHTFNEGAKRDSIRAQWYGRVLPADAVRRAFEDQLAKQGVTLEGNDKLPSASAYQRIARRWWMTGLNVHGTSAMQGGRPGGEELIAIVCREIARGDDPEWPQGRLTIVGLQGETSTGMETGRSGGGEAILLADQPLPAGKFSSELIYSHHRFDDVHGKPWIQDPDSANTVLNIMISKEREYVERALNAPTIVGSPLIEDAAEYDGFTILELEPGSTIPPRTMEIPASPARMIKEKVADLREYIFRVGGYQAASRGESFAGQAAAAIVALSRNDDTIHGPIHVVFQESMQRLMSLCWANMKEFGDVGWILNAIGEDYAHLADGYVDRTKLSEREPSFRLVSGYGATPETQGQQLLNMVVARGADGQPLLTTAEFRRRWPDQSLYADDSSPEISQKRRAHLCVEAICGAAAEFRKQSGMDQTGMLNPWVKNAGYQVFMDVEQEYIRLRDDNPDVHIAALTELTQDEGEDPVARWAAIYRQGLFYEWKAQIAQAQMGGPPGAAPGTGHPGSGGPAGPGARGPGAQPTGPAPDARGAPPGNPNQPNAGSPATASNPAALHQQVTSLTSQAEAM